MTEKNCRNVIDDVKEKEKKVKTNLMLLKEIFANNIFCRIYVSIIRFTRNNKLHT